MRIINFLTVWLLVDVGRSVQSIPQVNATTKPPYNGNLVEKGSLPRDNCTVKGDTKDYKGLADDMTVKCYKNPADSTVKVEALWHLPGDNFVHPDEYHVFFEFGMMNDSNCAPVSEGGLVPDGYVDVGCRGGCIALDNKVQKIVFTENDGLRINRKISLRIDTNPRAVRSRSIKNYGTCEEQLKYNVKGKEKMGRCLHYATDSCDEIYDWEFMTEEECCKNRSGKTWGITTECKLCTTPTVEPVTVLLKAATKPNSVLPWAMGVSVAVLTVVVLVTALIVVKFRKGTRHIFSTQASLGDPATDPLVVYMSYYADTSHLEQIILTFVATLRSICGVEVVAAVFKQTEIGNEGVPRWCERMYKGYGKMLVLVSPKYLEVYESWLYQRGSEEMKAKCQEDHEWMRVCGDISHMVNSRYSNGQQYNGCLFLVPYSKTDKECTSYKVKVGTIMNCHEVHDWPVTLDEYKSLARALQNIEEYQCSELNTLPNTPTSGDLPNMFGDENHNLSLMDKEVKINISRDDLHTT